MNHGTRAAYLRGCRCEDCGTAHRRYVKAYKLRTRPHWRTGKPATPIRVPIGPVQEHIERLLASGWTKAQIQREAGLSSSHISHISRGDYPTTNIRIADAILAVEPLVPDDTPDAVVVDRLVAGADWRAIGATRAERIAAAEKAWAYWGPLRRAEKAQGTSDQWLPGESLTAIERRLGLRAGRDFNRREVAA